MNNEEPKFSINPEDANKISDFNEMLKDGNKFMAVAVYMPGCGHCESLKPEWIKLEKAKIDNVSTSWVHMDATKHLDINNKEAIQGFPFICGYQKGKIFVYESGQRSVSDLKSWINSKMNGQNGGKNRKSRKKTRKRSNKKSKRKGGGPSMSTIRSIDDCIHEKNEVKQQIMSVKAALEPQFHMAEKMIKMKNKSISYDSNDMDDFHNYKNMELDKGMSDQLTHLYDRLQKLKDECPREKVGGKWSRKYKKRINCKRPKGFSQKQYCKYGRNKSSKKKRTVKRRRSRR